MARSSLALGALLACGGCDLAFGFDTNEKPCDVAAFDNAKHTDLGIADDFSVDWDQRFAVLEKDGTHFEMTLPKGEPTSIDLGPYPTVNLSLTPEGNALFYTASIEPMLLQGALRKGDASWQLAATVPRGTFVGTPSADVFGTRHVLVQLRQGDAMIQEYIDDNGHWVTIGDAHPYAGEDPPNLTPNGLTAVYAQLRVNEDATYTREVYAMTRDSVDAWFGAPLKILTGDEHPQLVGQCNQLYTTHDGQMRRYDR